MLPSSNSILGKRRSIPNIQFGLEESGAHSVSAETSEKKMESEIGDIKLLELN